MIETDLLVATITPSSTFNRSPAGLRNRDADDLDRLAASVDALTLCGSKPDADKIGDDIATEPVAEYKQLLGDAVRMASKQP